MPDEEGAETMPELMFATEALISELSAWKVIAVVSMSPTIQSGG